MKNILKYLFCGVCFITFISCSDYLDINENPNQPTQATAQTVLPQAIVSAASLSNSFNISFGSISGMVANAGGFSGFGSFITYEYTTGDFTGLWSGTMYNNLDFKYVIDNTKDDPQLIFYTSVARIMKALNFARLVDQYNDIPYTEALQGADNLTPAYDKAEDVYKAIITELTETITAIQSGIDANAQTAGTVASIDASYDPLFGGNMQRWMKFANTIKLRMLIKMAGVPALNAYAIGEFGKMGTSGVGFLSDNALVNPGYVKESGKAAPIFVTRGYSVDGGRPTSSRIATTWMVGFYDGGKVADPYRGHVIYQNFPNTAANQLGVENSSVPEAPGSGTVWTTGDDANDKDALGVCKGYSQGQPIMLAAESYFLQAEAYLKGYLPGNAQTAFNAGIKASFDYLYRDANGSLHQGITLDISGNPVLDGNGDVIPISVDDMVAQYITDNTNNYRVNWAQATTNAEKLEAIITQKYIALNMVNNDEAYNEYRRTKYPKTVLPTSNPLNTFASTRSVSTRSDKLLGRILYPDFEYSTNAQNVPNLGTSARFTGKIFWEN